MSGPQDNVDQPLQRPNHHLAANVPGRAAVDDLVDDLERLDVHLADVRVLHGERGSEILDVAGEHHGRRARISRAFKSNGVDGNMLALYGEALGDGKFLVLVPLSEDRPREEIIDALRRHGAADINYFAHGGMETIY